MKNNYKILLVISLLLMPTMVFATSGDNDFPIIAAIAMEAFVSIHMSVFVLKPASELISKENSKKTFWTLFFIRVCILLFFDFFITTNIAIIDFLAVFFGAFLLTPLAAVTKRKINIRSNQIRTSVPRPLPTQNQVNGVELKCAKCNAALKITDKFCGNCGEPFDGNNVIVLEKANETIQTPQKVVVLPTNFDKIYSLTEDKMLEEFINRELTKAHIDKSSKLIPDTILKKKKNLNIIFSVLVFVFITSIFFHFPIYSYIIGLIILFIFFIFTMKYDLVKYLKKEIKARPSEKISNIVMNVKNTFITDDSKNAFIVSLLVAIILPLIIFSSPRILYEKVDGGYAVRYYIFGLTNFKTVNIPKTYKNEKVVSLRGNTFSNMPFLESVRLPDSITEIRGQAFKNCRNLKEVNIPKKLEYLGGGAFYNAKSIKKIELPDTLTYLGGESFYGAKSLESIKLSENLEEIRGNSFEYCTSLKSITIPDNVTRIGGHAFYGDTSLSEVKISENSKLVEIGSSAFRRCSNLYNIKLSRETYVNMRAFKESPTSITYFSEPNYTDYEQENNDGILLPYESLYEKVDYKSKQLQILDPNLKLEYYVRVLSDNVYLDGHFTNLYNSDEVINVKIHYYDNNYNNIGSCEEEVNLGNRSYFLCYMDENENKITNNVAYYKIFISKIS